MFVLLFFPIALFSEIVGTVAGFGSSVFFVPLAGLQEQSLLDVPSEKDKFGRYGILVRCDEML